jgi:hypothetical protein
MSAYATLSIYYDLTDLLQISYVIINDDNKIMIGSISYQYGIQNIYAPSIAFTTFTAYTTYTLTGNVIGAMKIGGKSQAIILLFLQ